MKIIFVIIGIIAVIAIAYFAFFKSASAISVDDINNATQGISNAGVDAGQTETPVVTEAGLQNILGARDDINNATSAIQKILENNYLIGEDALRALNAKNTTISTSYSNNGSGGDVASSTSPKDVQTNQQNTVTTPKTNPNVAPTSHVPKEIVNLYRDVYKTTDNPVIARAVKGNLAQTLQGKVVAVTDKGKTIIAKQSTVDALKKRGYFKNKAPRSSIIGNSRTSV